MDDLEIKLRQDIGLLEWQIRDLLPLIDSYSREARINEILKMRAVGDKIAAQASPSFEELATAYDNHILKRAADLTELKALGGKDNE